MKISDTEAEQALYQLNAGTEIIQPNHPAATRLHEIFGHHTFFLDDTGLKILEPITGMQSFKACELIAIADLEMNSRSALVPGQPRPTGIIVKFREACRKS